MYFRKLVAFDKHQLTAHYRRLNSFDRYCRFFTPVSDAFLELYADKLGEVRRRYVGVFADGALRAVGELALDSAYPYVLRAEIAVSVEEDFRRNGLGYQLVERLVTMARNRSVREIAVPCLPENHQMRRLIHKFEGRGVTSEGVFNGRIAPPLADVGSGWREVMQDISSAPSHFLERLRA